jgi:hypothetical protein
MQSVYPNRRKSPRWLEGASGMKVMQCPAVLQSLLAQKRTVYVG